MQVFRLRFTRTKRIAIEKARQEIVTAKAAIDSLFDSAKKGHGHLVLAQKDDMSLLFSDETGNQRLLLQS